MNIKNILAPFFSFFLLAPPIQFPQKIDEIYGIEIIESYNLGSYITPSKYNEYLKAQINQYVRDIYKAQHTGRPLDLTAVSESFGLPSADKGVVYVIPEYIGSEEEMLLFKLSSVNHDFAGRIAYQHHSNNLAGVQLVPLATSAESRRKQTRSSVETLSLTACATYIKQILSDAIGYDRVIFVDRNAHPLGIMAESIKEATSHPLPEISYFKCTSEKKIAVAAEAIGARASQGYDAYVNAIIKNIPPSDRILIIDDWTKKGETRTIDTTIRAFCDAGFDITDNDFWPFVKGTGHEEGYVNPRFFDEDLRYILPSDWGKIMEWKDEHLCIGAEYNIDRVAFGHMKDDEGKEIKVENLFESAEVSKGPYRFLALKSQTEDNLAKQIIQSYPLIDPSYFLAENDLTAFIKANNHIRESIKSCPTEYTEDGREMLNLSRLVTDSYHEKLRYYALSSAKNRSSSMLSISS